MFDTGRAARHLGLPKHSLQYLVDSLCQVQLNKEFQTTDWRVRPLPEEMMHYAREDTHYLLYCYDLPRERLFQPGNERTNNLLEDVYRDSKEICKKVFESTSSIPQIKEESQNRQIFALRELWRWGDTTARNQDESLGYVLHMMIHIAESLPRDKEGVLACCSPVPHPLKEHLLLIHRIILEARDRGLEVVETAKKYLVDSLCQVQLNKEFQTTDWRVRPLPEEMMHYAREDTHYLLYCYDLLRERLLQTKICDLLIRATIRLRRRVGISVEDRKACSDSGETL
ncbi:unnamed protein product, partial [Mesorhabditis belari]|uniref:3'-5' exonuclease domain-containing protein n=1 Tax=Mesorhabditis belari TaxID=2138241 RepID=A0AAF3EI13_9BILA